MAYLNNDGLLHFWGKIKTKLTDKAEKSDVYTKTETDSQITAKIAEVVANAPEDFDTLKEMSDWIAGHENDAAAMNSAIQTNAGNISDLQTNKANVSDLDNYVEKLEGKGLSTNDYTTAEKEKLANAEISTNKVTSISETSTDTEYPSAKAVYDLANAGYEVKKITLNNDIGWHSWQANVYKFPNNLGIMFLNITWDNPSDTHTLKIGTTPNDCKPLFSVAQNIVSNGYLDNKNIAYLHVETTGEIYVNTGGYNGAVVPATGIRLIIPYIIA